MNRSELILFSAAVLMVGAGVGEETPFSVMTFNLRYATATDGANSWPFRKGVVLDTLRHYAPDILGVQECLDVQARFLAQELPEYRWIGMERESDGTGEMPAVFYRARVLKPLQSGTFWMSETPDVPGSKSWNTECTRITTWALFWHVPSGKRFCFFNTHFDHASEEARCHSAKLLADQADVIAPGVPVVVTGDFNASAGHSEAWQTFMDRGFTDSWIEAVKRQGPEYTYGGFKPPVLGRNERIDWVLKRGPWTVSAAETVTFNLSGRFPSDHYPVFVRLGLPE